MSSIPLGPPRPAKLKPPSRFCWADEPAGGAAHGRGRCAVPAGAEGEHGERGPVHLLAERPVGALPAPQRAHEVAAAEMPGIEPGGAHDEDRPLQFAGVGQAGEAGADRIDRRAPAPARVERVASGGGEAEREDGRRRAQNMAVAVGLGAGRGGGGAQTGLVRALTGHGGGTAANQPLPLRRPLPARALPVRVPAWLSVHVIDAYLVQPRGPAGR